MEENMDYNEWEEKYGGAEMVNHIPDGTNPKCIWTAIDTGQVRYITNGVWHCNVSSYYVTGLPCNEPPSWVFVNEPPEFSVFLEDY